MVLRLRRSLPRHRTRRLGDQSSRRRGCWPSSCTCFSSFSALLACRSICRRRCRPKLMQPPPQPRQERRRSCSCSRAWRCRRCARARARRCRISIAARARRSRRPRSTARCRWRKATRASAPKRRPKKRCAARGRRPSPPRPRHPCRTALGDRSAQCRNGDDAAAADAAAAGRLARRRAQEPAEVRPEGIVQQSEGADAGLWPAAVRHQGRRVRTVDPPLHFPGAPQLVRADGGHDDARACGDHVLRAPQRRADRRDGDSALGDRVVQYGCRQRPARLESHHAAAAGVSGRPGVFYGHFYYNESPSGR